MTRVTTAVAGVLAVLSAGFAAVHVAWALGWRGGVPAGTAPIGQRPVFLTYDVVAAVLMVLAAGVAVVLVRTRPHPPPLLVTLTLVGSVAALARGVPALAIDVVAGDLGWAVGPVADLWFTVVGVLGLVLWRGARRDLRRTTRARRNKPPARPVGRP